MIRNPTVTTGGGGTTPTLPTITTGNFGLQGTALAVDFGNGVDSTLANFGTLSEAVDELVVCINNGGGRPLRITVFVDAVQIIQHFAWAPNGQNVEILFPIRVPAGAITVGLASNSTGTQNMSMYAKKYSVAQTTTSVAPLVAISGNLAITGVGVTVSDTPSWTAIGSPLAAEAKAIIPSCGTSADASRTTATFRIDVSIDGGTTTLFSYSATGTGNQVAPGHPVIWGNFPAGTQFHIRATYPSAGSDSANFHIGLVT